MIEFKGKKILLDIGIHPGIQGLNGLPFVDYTDPEKIDILLISHFHLDHCGGLPWFLLKTSFKGRVFMTHATKARVEHYSNRDNFKNIENSNGTYRFENKL